MPNQQAAQKQVAKQQIHPPEATEKSSDSRVTEFYTYNSQQKDNTEAAKIIFDGLLVLANIGLIWVGIRQANILHKHEDWMRKHDANLEKLAKSAQDNAEAATTASSTAKDSFQSVVDSERAWVVADVPKVFLGSPIGTMDIFCTVRNRGKTMAHVFEKGENLAIEFAAEKLPTSPDYGKTAKWPTGVVLSPASESVLTRTLHISDSDMWQKVMNGAMVLFVFGFVKYLDVFGRAHETRYIFRFETTWNKNGDFYIEYKDEYSSAT